MKNKWQHIIASILLFAIMFPLCFVLLSYSYEVKQVKRKVKWMIIDGIPMDELVCFQFDMQEAAFSKLNWKHSREFELDGNMFDIVKGDTTGTVVKYHCYPDHQETALNKRLAGQLNDFFSTDNATSKKSHKLKNLITNLFIVYKPIYLIPKYYYLTIGVFTKHEKTQWKNKYKGPPPKFI